MSSEPPCFGGLGSLADNANHFLTTPYDLFSTRELETVVRGCRSMSYYPINGLDSDLEFMIDDMFPYYMQMKSAKLYLLCRVVAPGRDTWDSTVETGVVAPVNLIGPSLIQAVEIEINHKPAPQLGNNLFHYKNFFETMLTFGSDAARTHLDAIGYYADDGVRAGDAVNANKGFTARRTLVKKGRQFPLCFPVLCDFLQCEQPLIPRLKMKVRFVRSPPAFYMFSNAASAAVGYRIKFDEAVLTCNFIELAVSLRELHLKTHKTKPVRMPMTKVRLQNFDLTAGSGYANLDLFSHYMPNVIIVGFVASKAFQGDIRTDPYHFEHFNLDTANLRVNGEMYPSIPYRPRFSEDENVPSLFLKEYDQFLSQIGMSFENTGSWMSPTIYERSCFLLSFDLTPDRCAGWHAHEPREGRVMLEIKWLQNLTEPVTVIVYSVHDAVAKIASDGIVTVDMGS